MKIGRNAPCPCGSGKKYKKCCLNNDQQMERMPSDYNGFIQPPPRETSHKIPLEASGIRIRPFGHICWPKCVIQKRNTYRKFFFTILN
jgi:hypothetical protein